MRTNFVIILAVTVAQIVARPDRRKEDVRQYTAEANRSVDAIFPSPSDVDTNHHNCDCSRRIDSRLRNLELKVAENAETVRAEIRQTNVRLQGLEWRGEEVKSAVENLRRDLSDSLGPRARNGGGGKASTSANSGNPPRTYFGGGSPDGDEGNGHFETVVRGVQLTVVALRGLNGEIGALKRNISEISGDTRTLLLRSEDNPLQRSPDTCTKPPPPQNCHDILTAHPKVTTEGIFTVQPTTQPFQVLCDFGTTGGGWTYILNRHEGTQDFYQSYDTYRHGFGNIAGGEFFLGLDKIHQLTAEVNELLVELEDEQSKRVFAHYDHFSVGPEAEGYPLKVLGGYSGTAGNSLQYHAGSKFSTKDKDQDGWAEGSCAQAHGGAWWYRGCDTSNLNGRYLTPGMLPQDFVYQGMYWGDFHGAGYSLSKARMMVRPRRLD